MASRRERLRAAAELQREAREQHGAHVDAVMAQAFAASGRTHAERTYREAMARNSGQRFSVNDAILPERVLHAEETVLDVAVGGLSSDTFPLLLVTDRRVILTIDQPWRRWKVRREAPLADVLGAEVVPFLRIFGRLRVKLRQGEDIVLKLGSQQRPKEVAALINRLVSEGTASR